MREFVRGISLIVLLVLFISPVFADEQSPRVHFQTREHDFGKVQQGTILSHTFSFTNKGEGTLEIKGIRPG